MLSWDTDPSLLFELLILYSSQNVAACTVEAFLCVKLLTGLLLLTVAIVTHKVGETENAVANTETLLFTDRSQQHIADNGYMKNVLQYWDCDNNCKCYSSYLQELACLCTK